MTNTVTTRHAQLDRAIRNLRRTQLVGEGLVAFLVLLLCALQWTAETPEAHVMLGLLAVAMLAMGIALHDYHLDELARYRQRCNRMMHGFEQGYAHALACTRFVAYADTDYRLGYDDGYVAGIDERNARIRLTVLASKRDIAHGESAYLQDLV